MIRSHTRHKTPTRLLMHSLGWTVRRLREYRTAGHDYWVRC
jgi:hypothetical protein